MDIGIRELKQRLSECLSLVEAGAHIRVTDRGVPCAMIVPIVNADRLQTGVEEGWLRPATRVGKIGQGPRFSSTKRSADALREDRGE